MKKRKSEILLKIERSGSKDQLLLNYWQGTAWVQSDSAFNKFESPGDFILTFIDQSMIMYEAHMSLLVVTYEHEATLLAHLPDLLLHLLELVRVRLFISNENNQDVRLF